MTLIETKDMSVYQGNVKILDAINFSIEKGEIVTIVGPNGSGKSTFVRALIGAISPRRGNVTCAAGLRIGYVPQKLHVDPTFPMTVVRFLALPQRRSEEEISAALQEVGLSGCRSLQMADLSGGQFQRVLLARAILSKPDILILDEATQGLDQPGAAAFYRRIEQLRHDHGCAVLMVSHDLHVVMSASDRVICLNGHICCEGRPEIVASAPEYRAIFGTGTKGALALYRHEHGHSHEHGIGCAHAHDPDSETKDEAENA